MPLYHQTIPSPIGTLHAVADDHALHVLTFATTWDVERSKLGELHERSTALLEHTAQQLTEYFAGQRQHFDLPLHFKGTPFQQQVWQALLSIPYGETISYGEQATRLGNPQAVRAIGRTNGLNPIAIIAPCHRVIGKSGQLTGYAGGLEAKRYLLELESKQRSLC